MMLDGDETPETNFEIKHDDGKSIAGCLEEFSLALEAIAKVFDAGKKEGYERGSWVDVESVRYKDAEWRHRLASHREYRDKKSNLPHKYHEIWNMLAQLELDLRMEIGNEAFFNEF